MQKQTRTSKFLPKIAREITGTNWNGKLFFKVGNING